MKRGAVIFVDFPYHDKPGSKIRPALVVQNDRDNQRLANTIIAMITGNVRYSQDPTNLLVDPTQAEGAGSGLHGPSLVKCGNLFTVTQAKVVHTIGTLSPAAMQKIDQCLRVALALP